MEHNDISLSLKQEEAVVLFEFLSRFSNSEKLEIKDQAEERVLWDLCSFLEESLSEPLHGNWKELLEKARNSVRDTQA
ncbi:hypothetical protein ACM66T_04945 [Sulfurimonas sp. ST-25]|uniref:hypothetical protein n=1 Tax=Sulfurimonas sp. ST-25 TaxID=3400151 RepID=UPI003A89E609